MLPLRSSLLALALLGGAVLPARGAEWLVPPLSGELAGDFTPLQVPDGPKLHWRVTARDAGGGNRDVSLALDGPGARVRLTARLDAAANGTWRVDEASVDLVTWLPVAAAFVEKWTKFTLTGTVEASGAGTLRDGQLGGRAHVRLRDGRIDAPKRKLVLEGVAFELAIEDLATGRTAPAQRLTWTRGKYGDVAIGAGRFAFAAENQAIHVSEGAIDVFAGQLLLDAFQFSLGAVTASARATVKGFDLAQLQPFMPKIVSDSRGRLDGTLNLVWGPEGLRLGNGELALRTGEKAELRFMPQQGFLAGSLPPLLTKYYTGLADLEQGKVPLRADLLDVVLTPGGDGEGRTAIVHLAGGPVDPRLVAPVDLTFNVRAPLDWFVDFGSRIH